MNGKRRKRILGVDLGVTSFGYGIVETEKGTSDYTVVDKGVVTRDRFVNDPKSGKTPQKKHSEIQSRSKILDAKKKRRYAVAEIMEKHGVLTVKECRESARKNTITNQWELRADDVWKRPLSPEELYAIFKHMADHRGYKSLSTEALILEEKRKAGVVDAKEETPKTATEEGDDAGFAMAAMELDALRKKYPGETVVVTIRKAIENGEHSSWRNHDNREKVIRREHIEEEIEKVVARQYEMGAFDFGEDAAIGFVKDMKEAIIHQDLPTIDISKFGTCPVYPEEICAPKFSYVSDMYRIRKHLADLRIDGNPLSKEERSAVTGWIEESAKKGSLPEKITYTKLRKILKLPEERLFNGMPDRIEGEKKDIPRVFVTLLYLPVLGKTPGLMRIETEHESPMDVHESIATALQLSLTPTEGVAKAAEALKKHGVSMETLELLELFAAKGKRSGTMNLSHRFMREALPLFEEGLDESGIREHLGISTKEEYGAYPKSVRHLHLGKGNHYERNFGVVNNHEVKTVASWSLGLIADLDRRYGPFDEIVVETARDALPPKRQKAIEIAQKRRDERISKTIEAHKKEIPGMDRRLAAKIILLEECGGIDIYTGRGIGLSDILDGRVEIEHVIPKSLGGSNADYNLVLAYRDTNTRKGNRLPGDIYGHDPAYKERVERIFAKNGKKKRNLLAETIDDAYIGVSDTASMRATSHIERVVTQVLKCHYPFPDPEHRENGVAVRMVPGKTTSRMRGLLGVKSKSRSTNFHHAEDALILATLDRGLFNRIHKNLRENYGKSKEELKKMWASLLPTIDGRPVREYLAEAAEKFHSKDKDPEGKNLFYRDMNGEIRTVSHFVRKKPGTGAAHGESVYSAKYFERFGQIIARKKLSEEIEKMGIAKKRHSIGADEIEKKFEELVAKTVLHLSGEPNHPVCVAIRERGKEIVELLEKYRQLGAKDDKELDEKFRKELGDLIASDIVAGGNPVRKIAIVPPGTGGAMGIRKRNGKPTGYVTKEKNAIGIFVEKSGKGIDVRRVDVTNKNEFAEKSKKGEGRIFYMNEPLFFFDKKGQIVASGALGGTTTIDKMGIAGKVMLFNPKFPRSPKFQPSHFATGKGSLKEFGIKKAVGVLKITPDLTGRIIKHEKIGIVPSDAMKIVLEGV